jgi:hypothetical protein
MAPITLRVAIVNGLGNAKKLLKEAPEKYHFVEVMACPGGCIGGGGQPRSKDKTILEKRKAAIYGVDERCVLRRSHDNPVVKELYNRWLDKPGSPRAEALLHTEYVAGGPQKYDITLGENLQTVEDEMQLARAKKILADAEAKKEIDKILKEKPWPSQELTVLVPPLVDAERFVEEEPLLLEANTGTASGKKENSELGEDKWDPWQELPSGL